MRYKRLRAGILLALGAAGIGKLYFSTGPASE